MGRLAMEPGRRHRTGTTRPTRNGIRRTRVLLFGGQGSAYFGDTWDWDGKHWTQLQDIGPGPRAPAGMVYDSDRGHSVLFGGVSQNAYLGDTWELYDHPEPDCMPCGITTCYSAAPTPLSNF